MYFPQERLTRLLSGILILALVSVFFFHENNFDHILDWSVQSVAEKENFIFHTFQKGPFNFDLEGQKYFLTETFFGQDVDHIPYVPSVYMYLIWFLTCGLVAIGTNWKKFGFIVLCGLIFIQINLLDLDALGIFGSRQGQKWVTIIMMVITLGPAYYFHDYRPNVHWGVKWIFISIPSVLLLCLAQYQTGLAPMHFIANSHFGYSILTIIFILIVSEEILFLLLYFISRTKGNNNEKHFIIFSLAFLIYLGVYYAQRIGVLQTNIYELDPFYLIVFSSLIAIWSMQFKQEIYNQFSSVFGDIRSFVVVLGLIAFVFLLLGTLRGNSPMMESMRYMSLYAHLGFGLLFLIYVIVNFLTPLVQGLAVYRIAYKDHNFPYISSRLGGLVAVVAMFFYSDREPMKQIEAGRYNFLGDIYESVGNAQLSNEYYRQGAVFGWDNHYSNYKLGSFHFNNNNFEESVYRFTRATIRQPSPQAFVNAALSIERLNDEARAPAILREGNLAFPGSGEIANNFALALRKAGSYAQATDLLSSGLKSEKWNSSIEVNKWSMIEDSLNMVSDFQNGNNALKSNILAMSDGEQVPSTLSLNPTNFRVVNLHSISLLINASWLGLNPLTDSMYLDFTSSITSADLNKNLIHSQVGDFLKKGNINKALLTLENLDLFVTDLERGFYLNQAGLIYMEQGAYEMAIQKFTEAIGSGENAQFNRATALLEAGKWSEASYEWSLLAQRDVSYRELFNQIESILNNEDNDSYAFLYYRLLDIDLADLEEMLGKFHQNLVTEVWNKLSYALLKDARLTEHAQYFEIFESHLPESSINQFQEINSINLTSLPKSAFDFWTIIPFLNSDSVGIETKYDFLVEARQINPSSILIQKEFARTAIENGLPQFAAPALNSLKSLLSDEEFNTFEREFNNTLEEYRDQQWPQLDFQNPN